MAINQRIITKLDEKTKSDIVMRNNIKKVLAKTEEGRQVKRIINDIIKIL